MHRILMVEDSPSNAELYATYLRASGMTVTLAGTGGQALDYLVADASAFDLVVLDLGLPDMDGLEILRKLGGPAAMPPTVVLTGSGSVRRAVEAMREGAIDFLVKPCGADKLRTAVEEALERRTPTAEGRAPAADPTRAKRGPSGFLGSSPAMSNVFSLIEAAAASSTASVFITGETGTGKELCANAIHNLSDRRNGPFVAINCGAIPRELMESEIFGHRKGAFTGAINDREGAASRADGGTLFLDELCEMDLDLQVKLLRFIQTGTYRKVGDGADRQVNIRFVCATNRDPLVEVKAGRFREDLYYRLYVVPIHLPPLSARGDDIILLARRFLADFSKLEGKRFQEFSADALGRIMAYRWPGNVRQLENVVRNIVVLNDGVTVEPTMLPPPLDCVEAVVSLPVDPQSATGAVVGGGTLSLDEILARPLAELEAMAIDAALRLSDNNVTRAARLLDVSPSTIYRKHSAYKSGGTGGSAGR
ncbi:sigma-54-dependent transcriptional regulator [Rhodospirillum rubrum]|uniref:Two component, sigma54 specific, transcriptional regulator, Fis family n=1 Tax=Rhodospirillum rubrum (strain ATCC 11170 / ATH 1.1.1 / DSM 467 / LMG 4362 / NCIMB 8255 / S1) TaxID=269796 RepID=Q2RSJ4_RHORT|nr:sigma-54 dependent transcriptional regulator [Rhodospirillum rubrum]ABC22901.1 two component, sigma54 specific, transcriptional regulator, Fis family [Rhodospirillum rubrum ATCC 11170]MBK5954506.1 sigma-54-dependent Fis family transcriptional regulator [Rhodospirillum rubrum]QXG78888.1 sigma-54 dependent transcriptional regulator [Rhodospirillum rubrum]HCF17182.1 sigma-54-dependent Fis family transcriptional regulator [Rhodospirillum rubrum]